MVEQIAKGLNVDLLTLITEGNVIPQTDIQSLLSTFAMVAALPEERQEKFAKLFQQNGSDTAQRSGHGHPYMIKPSRMCG